MPGFLCLCPPPRMLALIALLAAYFPLKAHLPLNEPPLSFVYLPPEFEDGDTIAIEFHLGTQFNRVEATDALHLVHTYSGYKIDPTGSFTANMDESWFCGDQQCDVEIWADHNNYQLHVSIRRSDDEPVSGYGLVLIVGGIEVLIDDISARKKNTPGALSALVQVFPNPVSDYAFVKVPEGHIMRKIEVFDVHGRRVREDFPQSNSWKLAVHMLPPQLYLLRIETDQDTVSHRLQVLR